MVKKDPNNEVTKRKPNWKKYAQDYGYENHQKIEYQAKLFT